jgi:phosphatidylethanolamine-binding protein (PEBP) family uncharacterized protein
MSLSLVSADFDAGGSIPAIHTCDGTDAAPTLSWSGAPPATKSFALIIDDPDAPDPAAPKMTWVHWVLYNIPVGCQPALEHPRDGPAAGYAHRSQRLEEERLWGALSADGTSPLCPQAVCPGCGLA